MTRYGAQGPDAHIARLAPLVIRGKITPPAPGRGRVGEQWGPDRLRAARPASADALAALQKAEIERWWRIIKAANSKCQRRNVRTTLLR